MSTYPPLPEPQSPSPNTMQPNIAATVDPIENSDGLKPAPIWLQRLSLIVQVMFCVYLGILLVILPWWPHLLDSNELISSAPTLHRFLSFGAVRGIISGIGLIDIWIGISEVVYYYHEVRS